MLSSVAVLLPKHGGTFQGHRPSRCAHANAVETNLLYGRALNSHTREQCIGDLVRAVFTLTDKRPASTGDVAVVVAIACA